MAVCVNSVKRNNSPLSPSCFTFVREAIYREPNEVVRMAGVPNVAGRHRHTKARTAPGATASQSQTSMSSSSSASDCRELSKDSKLPTQQHDSVDVPPKPPVIGKRRSFLLIMLRLMFYRIVL